MSERNGVFERTTDDVDLMFGDNVFDRGHSLSVIQDKLDGEA